MPTKSEEFDPIDTTFLHGLEICLKEHKKTIREEQIKNIKDSKKIMICAILSLGLEKLGVINRDTCMQILTLFSILTAVSILDLKKISRNTIKKEQREIFFQLLYYYKIDKKFLCHLVESHKQSQDSMS